MGRELVIDALFDLFVVCQDFVVDNLHGIGITSIKVFGFKDLTVGTPAEQIPKLVTANYSFHLHVDHSRTIFHLEQSSETIIYILIALFTLRIKYQAKFLNKERVWLGEQFYFLSPSYSESS